MVPSTALPRLLSSHKSPDGKAPVMIMIMLILIIIVIVITIIIMIIMIITGMAIKLVIKYNFRAKLTFTIKVNK